MWTTPPSTRLRLDRSVQTTITGSETNKVIQEANHKVKQLLASFAERCAESHISFNVLQDAGLPYEEILGESQRYDLVMFGHDTHFRFGTVDQPDETLWKVLKRGPRPVVIAPPKLESGSSVVVAYNGSPQADRALQAFQSSGLDFGEEVCVVNVDDDREEATRQAERAVEFLRLHQINAVAHALGPVDSVSQAILEEVRHAAPACWSWEPVDTQRCENSCWAPLPRPS